ncbi:MAG: FdhF/YdeP family oxidoreductase [Spongiibacteraceae bacterium]
MSEKDETRIEPFDGPAGGWSALKSSAKHLLASHNVINGTRALLKANQPEGFDCPGCAWGEAPNSGAVDFCENGVKAVAWEATSARADAEFFARHSLTDLSSRDHHWLESQGRLTEPMFRAKNSDHYIPISWDAAFALIVQELHALSDPNQLLLYTSGRTSNEAAFLYQLFGRVFGTNNFPDCSNMCHEASGIALEECIGVGKGTVTFDDFDHADAIFVIGQNPGTNHPRMLATLSAAAKRGATVVAINTLRERGLQKFAHPQNPKEMLLATSSPISRFYITPQLGGDMALLRGVAKFILQWDDEARARGEPSLLDHEFISTHTIGFEGYRAAVAATSWQKIVEQSAVPLTEIEKLAQVYAQSRNTIITWAMGITQHKHSVDTVAEICHLLFLRGNFGRRGSGACPVRGHSNVQGDRTMGITEAPSRDFLERLGAEFNFAPPSAHGYNTVQAITAMADGEARVFIGMGGNFAAATPDTEATERALKKCALTVQISTKLNRSHTVTGEQALILPCLGRTERDQQACGNQFITVEDSMSMVHGSTGTNEPASPHLLSEPAIVCGIANAVLGNAIIDWKNYAADYDRIREKIAAVIPGFEQFNTRVRTPHGFYLGNAAAKREWLTPSGRAQFRATQLPVALPREIALAKLLTHQLQADKLQAHDLQAHDLKAQPATQISTNAPAKVFTLQTLRSHDQYNTTVYGLDDRYRGVYGGRKVLMMCSADIAELNLNDGDLIDIFTVADDGIERSVSAFRLTQYDIPRGCCAAYYPETNPLVPLSSYGDRSFTPTSKAIPVIIKRSD